MKSVLLIAAIIFIVAVIIQYAHAKVKTWGVVQIKSGSLGSGKTYLSVDELTKRYRKLRRKGGKKDVQ